MKLSLPVAGSVAAMLLSFLGWLLLQNLDLRAFRAAWNALRRR
jgi:hypothetical protein